MKPEDKLIITPWPHIASQEDVPKIMYGVIIALIPAVLAAGYFFGPRAIGLITICVAVSILTEYAVQRVRKRDITVTDGSGILTGVLLAFTIPPTLPFWAAALAAIVAMGLGKQIYGGLGHNIFNPALVGTAFLQAAFPVAMTTRQEPLQWLQGGVDVVSTATPLAELKFSQLVTPHFNLLVGNISGALGETSALALMLGAVYMIYRGYIDWRIPGAYLGTVAALGGFFWLVGRAEYPDPVFHMLAGGLLLGAFFMATDPVTSPITSKGQILFGVGAGILTVIIRLWGGFTEGVMYSILFMNALTPLINRYTKPQIFGKGLSRK